MTAETPDYRGLADELREADGNATEGPWELSRSGHLTDEIDTITGLDMAEVLLPQDEQGGASWAYEADAGLIVVLRNNLATIIAALELAADADVRVETARREGAVEALRAAADDEMRRWGPTMALERLLQRADVIAAGGQVGELSDRG